MRPVLTYGHAAWISAPTNFYNKLAILERHALRLAFRIQLPSPTRYLYEMIDFPQLLSHLEQLRSRFIANRIETQHPMFLDILRNDRDNDTQPLYHDTPIMHFMTLFHLEQDPAEIDDDIFEIYHPRQLSPSIYPSQAQ